MASTFRRCAAAVAFGLLAGNAAAARAAWPERPILLVHGFGAGGNADVIARTVAERLSARLGQPVVVEPRAGAGGRIAAAQVVDQAGIKRVGGSQ